MAPYKYDPIITELDVPTQNGMNRRLGIRLLHIRPAAFADRIHVDLQPVQLDPETPIEYEALSYTWGMAKSSTLYIGHDGDALAITDNLAVALRHLRLPTERRTMWIDAVCIDQASLDERSDQVTIMAEIYRLASRVMVWLGPQANYSNHALDILRDLAPKVEWDTNGSVDMAESAWDNWRGLGPSDHLILLNLFERPWFDRLWIRQEIFFSEEKANVQVGHATILWTDFSKAILFLWSKIVLHEDLNKRLTSLNELLSNAGASLQFLRRTFGKALCSDPRDRLYAVLNMLPDEHREFIGRPDYNRDAIQVWKETTLAYIRHYQDIGPHAMSLTILDECYGREPFDCPSWIPKWEVDQKKDHHRTLPFFGIAGGPFSPKLEYLDGDILRIVGVRVQIINQVYYCKPSEPWPWIVKKLFGEVNPEYPTGKHLIEACASTFTTGYIQEASDPPRTDLPQLDDIIEELAIIYISDSEGIHKWLAQSKGRTHYNVVSDMVSGRSIITSEDGYVGLAPPSTEPGDLVVAFAGRHSLTVIRETGPNTSKYYLIGQCFVDGFMSDDAFLGPLPPGHRYVARRLPDDNYEFIEVYDSQTDSYLRRDQRYESLPLSAEEQEKSWEAVQNRSPYTFAWDIERFQMAGIKAEYFDIV